MKTTTLLAATLPLLAFAPSAHATFCGDGTWVDHPHVPGGGYCKNGSYGSGLTGEKLSEANSANTCRGFYKTTGYYDDQGDLIALIVSNGNCEAAKKSFRTPPPEPLAEHCQKYGGTGKYRWMYYWDRQPFGGYGTLGVTCEVPNRAPTHSGGCRATLRNGMLTVPCVDATGPFGEKASYTLKLKALSGDTPQMYEVISADKH